MEITLCNNLVKNLMEKPEALSVFPLTLAAKLRVMRERDSNSEMKPVTFQKTRQLYAKRGKIKNRTSLLSESSIFIWRSVAESN
jgi:hypothetical protein